MVTPFPGAIETKPGAATVPFFGIEPAILDPVTGKVRSVCAIARRVRAHVMMQEIEGPNVEGVLVLKTPWPSIARTVYQDHKRSVA